MLKVLNNTHIHIYTFICIAFYTNNLSKNIQVALKNIQILNKAITACRESLYSN